MNNHIRPKKLLEALGYRPSWEMYTKSCLLGNLRAPEGQLDGNGHAVTGLPFTPPGAAVVQLRPSQSTGSQSRHSRPGSGTLDERTQEQTPNVGCGARAPAVWPPL